MSGPLPGRDRPGPDDPPARAAMPVEAAKRSALIALPFQIGFVALVIIGILIGLPSQPWLAALLAIALWAPAAVELVLRTTLPRALQLHYLVFMALGPFGGSALNVYGAIPSWDTLVHYDSGIMLAWLGMLMMRRGEERTGAPLPRWLTLSVIQMTPMAFAALWEVCEFTSDLVLGTVAQAGGLTDTMGDIIAGTLGGLTAIVLLLITRRPRTLAPSSLLAPR